MDDSWRFRPPVHGDPICPVCSFPHYPFCPGHHLAFRPPPFPGGRPMPPPPVHHNPRGPYPAPPPLWQLPAHQPPSFCPPPPPQFAYGPGGGGGWRADGDAVENGRVPKRTRLDSVGCGNQEAAPAIMADDERRLNLVRDHGGLAASRPPQFGPDFRSNMGAADFHHLGYGSRNGLNLPPDLGCRGTDQSGFGVQISNNGIKSNANFGLHKDVHDEGYNHVGMQLNGGLINQGNGAPHAVENHPIARQDGYASHHTSEMKLGHWPEDVYSKPNKYGGNSLILGDGSVDISGHKHAPQALSVRPSVPPLPPQPFPPCPPLPPPSQADLSPATLIKSSRLPFLDPMIAQAFPIQASVQPYISNRPLLPVLPNFSDKERVLGHQKTSKMHPAEHKTLTIKNLTQDKPKIINATHLFKHPHRATRPDHLLVILRGLPGSGKSYLAKLLRDVEVENGGNAPRIHSMDDYFMTEVEKVEEIEGSKSSSGLMKGKKRISKKVMEYCYEPEMEEAYRASMLKAVKKTLEEGIFTFIIVDDRNLRVADFGQFWAAAKTSGYEVYLLEATYKDPVGCAARNVHGFTLQEIQKMANLWEKAPPLYLQLDVQSLFCGDDLSEQGIKEVDMDMEDTNLSEDRTTEMQNNTDEETSSPSSTVSLADGSIQTAKNLLNEGEDLQEVKDLGKSKWSEDLEEDIGREKNDAFDNKNVLSGLMKAYTKGTRSVHWGDQVGRRGFSISAAKKSNISLIMGPGAGYNLASNPLPEEEKLNAVETSNNNEMKKRTTFLEHLQAECESFRAVFDRRRQRIGGFVEDD